MYMEMRCPRPIQAAKTASEVERSVGSMSDPAQLVSTALSLSGPRAIVKKPTLLVGLRSPTEVRLKLVAPVQEG